MPIPIVWEDTQHRVMRHVYPARWTLEDYQALLERSAKLIRGINHRVHIIVDRRQSQTVPSNILSLVRYAETLVQPNQGAVVYVQAADFTRTILHAARRIAPLATGQLHHVDTLPDAYRVIMRLDPAVELNALFPTTE